MCNGQGSRVEGAPLPAMVQGQFVVHSPGTKLSDAILSKTKTQIKNQAAPASVTHVFSVCHAAFVCVQGRPRRSLLVTRSALPGTQFNAGCGAERISF